ncbi:MAG TPA: hypothetical protein VN914_17445 [Polyangia bacterium]|nr:hypothetical protein [Polyangia bacterium]
MSTPRRAPLAAAVGEGRRRWPGVALAPEQLEAHLRRVGLDPAAEIPWAAELYLTAACALGDPAALDAFDREYVARLPLYVSRFGLRPDVLDDLRQSLRMRLLLDQPPRIGTYAGRGPLDGWVGLTAVRLALDLLAVQKSAPRPVDPALLTSGLFGATEPAFDLARTHYGPMFQTGLEEALAALGDRDKALLRFHFVERLNIEAIGRIYRVHRATVARWLIDLRRRLLLDVQERLAIEVHLSNTSEFRSLLDVVRDDLHVSLSRILGR